MILMIIGLMKLIKKSAVNDYIFFFFELFEMRFFFYIP